MEGITDPNEMYFKDGLWGWDGDKWIKILVDATGHIQIANVTHNLLDGSVHPDTVAGSPVKGDVVVGIDQGGSVIKWQRLARGTTGQVITVQADGTLAWATPAAGGYTEGARVYNSGDLTATKNAFTVLTFDGERYDTDTIHSTVTNTSRLTCKTAGKYAIVGGLQIGIESGKSVELAVLLNGATRIGDNAMVAAAATQINLQATAIYNLAVNDYVELEVWHNCTVDETVYANGSFSPEFAMQRIG